MGKREKKIGVISKYLKNCTTWSYSTYGNISGEKFDNACRAYAGNVDFEDVIGMIDSTVFGSGKRGFLFTEKGVYYSSSQGGEYFPYTKALEFDGWVGYNCSALNDMITRLKNIEIYDSEEAPSGWQLLGGLIQSTADFLTALSESGNEETKNADNTKMIEANTSNYVQAESVEIEEESDDEDILEMLEAAKSHLKNTSGMLGEYIDISIQSDQERYSYVYNIVLLAAIYSGDKELVGNDMFSEEDRKDIYDTGASAKELVEFVDSIFNNAPEGAVTEKVSFAKAAKLYTHRIKTVMEDFGEDNDIDEMYENSQVALKDLKSSIRKMTKNINAMIELMYSE